ncbi:RagB/SusD family nutrient uptake outer membrane protein [Butyricimonas sp.]|uniref:RagB/SusD family nutrient uptake outer membrane protein n=1 Tax=Butyricimonas sp. TaxID=1969738 RepID=UPI002579BB65|nr:RagB/SusD family nutrient uptake outer membrane protein [Butyricimonas sp.]
MRYKTCISYSTPNRPTGESGARMFGSIQVKWNCGGMRLSEVYLIVAECYARLNDPVNAMKYLNEMYKYRVKNGTPELTAADADEALKQVRNERKRELMFTYNGFFDMRRFSVQLNETFTRTYINEAGETKELTLKPGSPLYVWPFPQNAMETSNLIQNTK